MQSFFYVYVCAYYALQVWFTGFQVRVSGNYWLKPKENQLYEWQ